MIEPRSNSFVADYFTAEEQAFVERAGAADRPRLLALLWSGKESALKALRAGLRLDTRCVIVSAVDALRSQGKEGDGCAEDSDLDVRSSAGLKSWHPLHVRYTNDCTFHGWWQHTGNLLRTMVATPPPVPPILLKNPTK